MWSWLILLITAPALALTVPTDRPTISDALDDIPAGGQIFIEPGEYHESLTITKDVTLVGLGHASEVQIISPSAYPALSISGAEVHLQGLSLKGVGYRAVELVNATSTWTDVECTGAGVLQSGGCVNLISSSLTTQGSRFWDNSGINGGHIAVVSGELTLIDTQLTGGVASGSGGAIHLGAGASATFSNARFGENHAEVSGGAIFSAGGPVHIEDSRFHHHTAHDGGAVWLEGGSLLLERSTFQGNKASGAGGAVHTSGTHLQVNRGIFRENEAIEAGGAIKAVDCTACVVDRSWFEQNRSEDDDEYGGAIDWVNAPGSSIKDSWFGQNFATHRGGAVSIRGTVEAQIRGGWFCQNASGTSRGGAVAVHGVEHLYLGRSVFMFNEAGHSGAALYAQASPHALATQNTFVAHSTSSNGETLRASQGVLATSHNLIAWGGDPAFRGSGNYDAVSSFDWYHANGVDTDNVIVSNPRPVNPPSNPLFLSFDPAVAGCHHDVRLDLSSPVFGSGEDQRTPGAFDGTAGDPRWYLDADGDGFPAWNDCDDEDGDLHPNTHWYQDLDGDGYGDPTGPIEVGCVPPGLHWVLNDGDCDDTDPTSHAPQQMFHDVDGDGFGDPATGHPACFWEEGKVTNGDDCDDNDAEAYPGQVWTIDEDGDTFGAIGSEIVQCLRPPHGVLVGGDCDDTNPNVFPGQVEVCNEIDDNCSGLIDDEDPDVYLSGAPLWYLDEDEDGYGTGEGVPACAQGPKRADNADDCDDTDPEVGPPTEWWIDADGDGSGWAGAPSQFSCEEPPGYVSNADDCDDQDPFLHAGTIWYEDVDGDGFGNDLVTLEQCEEPIGFVLEGGDCDDSNAAVHPEAIEVCNGIDDNCDELVDDEDPSVDPASMSTFYRDADQDGYGTDEHSVLACVAPPGFVSVSGDCEDNEASINPGMPEQCDDIDHNCDGSPDDGVEDLIWYQDLDQDGWGNEAIYEVACSSPGPAYSLTAGDCDDLNPNVHPGSAEVCNGIDDDCDGEVDNFAVDSVAQAPDLDQDGYGDKEAIEFLCESMPGWVELLGDCDDTNPLVNPGADEVCNGIDDNCDGFIDLDAVDEETWYLDADGDGWGVVGTGSVVACDPPDGYGAPGDCDDADPLIHPGAPEVCNGIDDNCTGLVDDEDPDLDLTTAEIWYLDADGDGWGDPDAPAAACAPPEDHVADHTDCDDSDPSIYPGAPGWSLDCEPLDDGDDRPNGEGPDEVVASGCGCQTPGAAGAGLGWLWVFAVLAIRRRSAA